MVFFLAEHAALRMILFMRFLNIAFSIILGCYLSTNEVSAGSPIIHRSEMRNIIQSKAYNSYIKEGIFHRFLVSA